MLAIAPGNSEALQLRQSAEAMQAELGKIPAAPPPDRAASAIGNQETRPPGVAPATVPGLSGQALTDQARQLFDQSKFAEAIEVLGRALSTDPHNEGALRLRVLA